MIVRCLLEFLNELIYFASPIKPNNVITPCALAHVRPVKRKNVKTQKEEVKGREGLQMRGWGL